MAMEDGTALAALESLTTSVNERLDELGTQQDALATEVRERGGVTQATKDLIEGLEGELKDLKEAQVELMDLAPQLQEMKGKLERPGVGLEKHSESPGARFTESDEYKSWKDNGENKSRTFKMGSIDNLLPDRKALTSDEGVWGGAGVLIQPQLLPGILTDPQRELRFRDLINTLSISTSSVEYFMETGYANLYATLASNIIATATAIPLDATGVNTGVSGFFAGQTIMIGTETRVVASVNSSTNVLTITAGVTSPHTAGTEVYSDHLQGTPHGGLKPQTSIEFDSEVGNVITLAHWIAAHRQTLEDAPQLQGYINQKLMFGLEMALENQGLYGSGASDNLMGIFNHPNVQNQGTKTGNDANGNPYTNIDWIRKALTKAMVAQYPVNGIMVNPLDWETIEMAKDLEGRYLMGTATTAAGRVVFGVPVVVTTAVRAGEFLLGAFGYGVTLLDRQGANLRIADQHADFFVRNAIAMLAELRVGLIYPRPESLIKGHF